MDNLMGRCVLSVIVLLGAATDLRKHKIPNWLTLPAMVLGLVINGLGGLGFQTALFGMLVAIGIYFLFFAIGFRGAGDGKLMGAVGAFIGWPHIVSVIVLVALLAGAAAIVLSWQRGLLGNVLRSTASLVADIVCFRWRAVKQRSDFRAPGSLRLPHGPVIAVGTLVFLLFSPR